MSTFTWASAGHGRYHTHTPETIEVRTTGRGPRCQWRARYIDGPNAGWSATGRTMDDAAQRLYDMNQNPATTSVAQATMDIAELSDQLTIARARRDQAIRNAIRDGVPLPDIVRATRTSADLVWRAAGSALLIQASE